MSHTVEELSKMKSETWPWALTFNMTLKGAFLMETHLIGPGSKRMEKVQVKIMRGNNYFEEFSVNSITSNLGVAKRPHSATMDFQDPRHCISVGLHWRFYQVLTLYSSIFF